jgi:hypothetical protein
MEPRCAHHRKLKTSMADPLGGGAGARERPPPYVEGVDGGPPGSHCRSPGAPTTLS